MLNTIFRHCDSAAFPAASQSFQVVYFGPCGLVCDNPRGYAHTETTVQFAVVAPRKPLLTAVPAEKPVEAAPAEAPKPEEAKEEAKPLEAAKPEENKEEAKPAVKKKRRRK